MTRAGCVTRHGVGRGVTHQRGLGPFLADKTEDGAKANRKGRKEGEEWGSN